jgi:CheY-like chemotaxis protein
LRPEPPAASILVVDDDADIRETLQTILGIQGYLVATAADGSEALRWLSSGRPLVGLILLDLMMPGMNGFEFRSRVSADPRLSRIPIVVITGASILADARVAELRTQVLQKPIDLSTLLETVEGALSHHDAAPR